MRAGTTKIQGGFLSSCYCSPISPFFIFLFTEMHSIIVSDAKPTCSIPSFLYNIAAQSRPRDRIFETRYRLCQKSELQLMVEISPKTL